MCKQAETVYYNKTINQVNSFYKSIIFNFSIFSAMNLVKSRDSVSKNRKFSNKMSLYSQI